MATKKTLSSYYGIGQRIQERRESMKITQKELAKRANVSFKTVQNYEGNDVNPRIEVLEKIATALDCDIEFFLYGENPKTLNEKRQHYFTKGLKHPELFVEKEIKQGNKSSKGLFEVLETVKKVIDDAGTDEEIRKLLIRLSNKINYFTAATATDLQDKNIRSKAIDSVLEESEGYKYQLMFKYPGYDKQELYERGLYLVQQEFRNNKGDNSDDKKGP